MLLVVFLAITLLLSLFLSSRHGSCLVALHGCASDNASCQIERRLGNVTTVSTLDTIG
jgi:hypothetical protein